MSDTPEINVEVVNPPAPETDATTEAVAAIATAAALIDTAGGAAAEKTERTVAEMWDAMSKGFELMHIKLDALHADVRALQIAEIVEEEQAAEIEEAVEEAIEEVGETQELVTEQIREVAQTVETVPEKVEEQTRKRRWI